MKLDLINSRPIHNTKSYRVYDSVEGKSFDKPGIDTSNLAKVSFKSNVPKIDFMRKDLPAPNIFDRSKIDNRGFYIEVCNNVHPKPDLNSCKSTALIPSSSSLKMTGSIAVSRSVFSMENDNNTTTCKVSQQSSSSLHTPTLSKIKDKIYNPKGDTVRERVYNGKLPGGTWSSVSRAAPVRYAFTGQDNLDKFRHETGKYGIRQNAVKFGTMPTGRGEDFMTAKTTDSKASEEELVPLKVKIRLNRIQEKAREKEQRVLNRKLKVMKDVDCDTASYSLDGGASYASIITAADTADQNKNNSVTETGKSVIKFSSASRFEAPLYKQERYVKTGGMLLDPDWDRKLDKRMMTGFSQQSSSIASEVGGKKKRPPGATEGGDVDVDVGHYYSTAGAVERSPLKYSASFKSLAKVGMEIRPTTSPDHIGPGSFADAHPPAIEVRNPDQNSLFFLTGRKPVKIPHSPDRTEPIKPFAEQHTAGPVFSREGTHKGNVVMQNMVKQKMVQIYPKLANKHFPPPTVHREKIVVDKRK